MDATEPHSPVLKGEAGLRPAGFTSPSPSVYAMHASSSSEEGAVHSGDLGPSGAGPGLDAAYERYAFYPGAAMFDDEDEEDEGAEDYDAPRHCVNCTAPLWDDVCLDCGHDDAHTPSLFDPTPLSRRATNSAGPCPANSVDTCLPNASAVAHTEADARPRPRRRDAVTVVAYDDAMLLHQESEACPSSGGGAHPERPERLRAVWARLQAAELAERCVRLPSRPATDAELEAVHSRRLVRGLEALSEGIRRAEEREEEGEETAGFADAHQLGAVGPRGVPAPPPTLGASCDGGPASGVVPEPLLGVPPALTPAPLRLPPDTYACAATAAAARLGAGAAADAARAVLSGAADAGLAIVRPPGHHAESGTAQGFCFLNSAAVAAAAARAAGAARVLILDWDVHHGNGTQEIFAADPSVLYASLHRHEGGRFYPGTGAATDVGVGPGAGASLNVAWPRGGLTDADYAMAFATVILPVAREFDPDLVIISAGFDAAQGDPIGGCHLTPGLFASLTAALQATVAPCVAVLEGGYNLRATAACTEACARVLLGERAPRPRRGAGASPAAWAAVADAARAHASHWACMASLARALGVAPGVLPDGAGGGALGTLGVLGARAESCPALLAKGAAGVWRDEGGEAGDNLTEGPSSQGDADALSTPAAPACLGARPPSPDASLLHEEDDVIAADEALDPHAGEPRDAQQVEPRDAQEVKLVDVSAPRGAKPPRDVPAAARLFAASPNRAWSAAGLPSPPGHPIPSHRPPGAVHPAKRKFSECGPA
uniref:Histone deacetylase domain-containing protein n=1 Tax=Auxenochlorella protothecoides TaxID=3075 RepID=A0A1D2A3D2_AUXPR